MPLPPTLPPRLVAAGAAAFPTCPPDPVAFAQSHVRLPSSAISERFDCTVTPWLREPLLRAVQPRTRMVTFIKPIQCGGSTIGEILLCYWILHGRGVLLFNWENTEKARLRWSERIDPLLNACAPVRQLRDTLPRFADNICVIAFPGVHLKMQGAFNPSNLDSTTARFELNEEIHDWPAGHLVKAFGRTTMVWDHHIVNISNASKKGDQLDECWQSGTMQPWEVKCPGCGKHHVMRTRWEHKRAELGGLRYDADGSRLKDGRYNYAKLAPTIRYQMPCGHEVPEDFRARRAMSLTGRYAAPTNAGAHESHASYTLEAVAVDRIPWLKLIQEKHAALRARKYGDPEPWRRYVTERECTFYDPGDIPVLGKIVLSTRRKDRDGLKDRVVRFAALDRQQGSLRDGEIPHWWAVVRDVDAAGNSLLVHEAKHRDDEDLVQTLARLEVKPHHVVADSGDDTTYVYLFCMKHGYNAIKGDGAAYFSHPPDGTRKIFSVERPLHMMLEGHLPKFDYVQGAPDIREPMFWLYSKHGIAERLHWLRAGGAVTHEVPADVSEDYLAHQEAEELQDHRIPKTGELVKVFVQIKPRNDLLICERYIAMLMDMAGLIGATAAHQFAADATEIK